MRTCKDDWKWVALAFSIPVGASLLCVSGLIFHWLT